MALGATPANVLKLILRQGWRLIAAGLVAGVTLGWLLTSGIGHIFHGDTSVLVFFIAPALLAATGLFACYIPARRAMRADPIVALRYE
jgi:ABC-type antimicrobial peptide transport system permease subunit